MFSVRWKNRAVHCCTCSKSDPFKVLTTVLFLIQNSRQLLLQELSSLLRPCFFWRSYTYQHCVFLFTLLQLVYSTVQSGPFGPSLAMQHSRPTFACKPLILLRPTWYLLPLLPPRPLMILAFFLYLLVSLHPDSLRVL